MTTYTNRIGYADISDYGAIADDVRDNSSAIQAALDTGIPVYVPGTTSSFNFATRLTIPSGAVFFGNGNAQSSQTGLPSTLKYTGTGTAMGVNLGGSTTSMNSHIRGLNITTTQTTGGRWAIELNSATNVFIAWNTIQNFTKATGASGAIEVSGTIGADDITVFHNRIVNNSTCIHQGTTGASDVISGWRIIGNQFTGSYAAGGQDGALQIARPVQAMLFVGNDVNANANPNEIFFGDLVNGLVLDGNFINSTAAARNALKFGGTDLKGISVQGNFMYQSAANGTGRAVWFSAAGGDGILVRGNFINLYATVTNPAIDPGGFNFTNSDFTGNSINGAGANLSFGTFGASSTGTIWPYSLTNPTYGTSVAIDRSLGSTFRITATNNTAFTVANPTNAITGLPLMVVIRNTSGGALGTVTWDTLYKLSTWTSPATANSRSITFVYDGTNWVEVNRAASDVPN